MRNDLLKLGIIGLSDGNGHPYSWSAIFNGMNYEYMKDCPFPVIPEYLSRQKFPEDTIPNCQVDCIWTQNLRISEHVALASNIPNVVADYTDMIGRVDAILLARDDSKTHYQYAKPFIEAGLPIYIDKPLAISLEEAYRIYALEKFEGQVFSCSAMSFAPELILAQNLGEIRYVEATVGKDWEKYSIHIIDPVLRLLNFSKINNIKVSDGLSNRTAILNWDNGIITSFKTLGDCNSPIKIVIYGTKSTQEIIFHDTFSAFKRALCEFVSIVRKEKINDSKVRTLKAVEIIEKCNGK
ncbi:Gfo/Idh/MocA family oxidoreductase [Bacteroides sp. GD17]|jgi:predicted dehydrogenase|uniref:Gfo/Idh/MocA family protein n=1 Tax=Bacteroides sp. GD17 TaxID=3139826 RepID=UPI0025E0806D|nr:Gfo/Idh/MocA family oxidoreductase [uncultured Bacteroides sp.]